jgi:membrane protease YdiL (CAAX protease family)
MQKRSYPSFIGAVVLCIIFLAIHRIGGYIWLIFFGASGMGLMSVLAFVVVIFTAYKKSKGTYSQVFNIHKVPLSVWGATTIFVIGYAVLSSEISPIIRNFALPLALQNDSQSLFRIVDIDFRFIMLTLVIPPLAEEMLFRGVILSGFCENYSTIKSVILSSLLFSLYHLNPFSSVSYFIFGIVSALISMKAKSILPCIYIHLIYNVFIVLNVRYAQVIQIQPIWLILFGLVFAAIGTLSLVGSFKKTNNIA